MLHHLPDTEVIFAAERARGITDGTRTLTLHAQAGFVDVPSPDVACRR